MVFGVTTTYVTQCLSPEMSVLVWVPLKANKAPDEPLIQEDNFDTDLLHNVNSGHLNEEIIFSITHELTVLRR